MPTITKTLNSSGGDYTTWAAFVTAWNAGTISGASAADDIVLNVTQNAAFNERVSLTTPATAYASLLVTVDAAVRHTGTPGTGARLASTTTLTYASGNSAAGLAGIPKSEDIVLPSGTAIQLPAEPFYSRTVSEAAPSGLGRARLVNFGSGVSIG